MSSSIALKTGKTEEKVPDKIWNASFISVFIANMLMFMGQQMMNTLVAKYANHLGAAPIIVGLVTSAFAYTALISPFKTAISSVLSAVLASPLAN